MKLTISNLIQAIILDRPSDGCGPGHPSRAEARMLLEQRCKATDAVVAMAREAAEELLRIRRVEYRDDSGAYRASEYVGECRSQYGRDLQAALDALGEEAK